MFENIISGVIGGLIVLLVQYFVDFFKSQKNNKRNLQAGKISLKILDKDFLYKYEPHKISIEKVIEEFGQPMQKHREDINGYDTEVLQYNFQNGKVLFSKLKKSSPIVSITLFSKNIEKYPLLCRMSYEDPEVNFGEARITSIIIENAVTIANHSTQFGNTTTITCKYSHRQIRDLYFSYEIEGKFKKVQKSKGQLIKQVCITQIEQIIPTFTEDETFYN